MDAAGVVCTPSGANREPMTAVGQWRATYAPGEWLVLCGPASLVVVEPPGEGWTELIEELWQQVLASSSLVDLAARLAGYGLDTMPSFGALFWSADGMRSLVRGSVSVVDPATDRVVADGQGIQTWSEVGLGELATVLVRTSTEEEPDGLQLPLVVGAARASSVLLDAREQARVHSPQADAAVPVADAPEPSGLPPQVTEPTQPTDPFGAEPAAAPEHTVQLPDETAGGATTEQLGLEDGDTALLEVSSLPAGLDATGTPAGPVVEAVLCPHGHPNPPSSDRCRDCGVRVTDPRVRQVAQPALAVLRSSDGAEVLLAQTVLVGRAPAERPSEKARLLTVPSPSHDISRTHLQVVPDGWRIVVTDLHSTNGTLLHAAGEAGRRLLPPGEPVVVEPGSVLELADGVAVTVEALQ